MTAPWHDLPLSTVTPAFLGRFDSEDPEPAVVPFPVPSLRGVLAYWLRALAGAHAGDSISLLHDVESAVFGAARAGSTGGPSPIQLRAPRIRLTVFKTGQAGDGLRYLMGPGLTAPKEPPPRYLAPGPVSMRVRNTGGTAHADLFLAALWALRTFGGIGARSRRGFGTLATSAPPDLPASGFRPSWLARDSADDLEDVLSCVAAAITDLGLTLSASPATPGPAPRYPCFRHGHYQHSADTEDQLITGANWQRAFDIAGGWLRDFRHGADRKDPSSQPSHHSRTYTDVAQPFLDGKPQRGPVTAAALGLPIPYSDHQGPPRTDNPHEREQRTATVEVRIADQTARRASPLWLRIRSEQSTWRLRSLAFHDEWLPPAAHIRITGKHLPPAAVTRPTDTQIRTELNRWFGP